MLRSGAFGKTSSLLAVYQFFPKREVESSLKKVSDLLGHWMDSHASVHVVPISQMWTNFLNLENIKGLSAYSILLAMIGNGLLIPRPLFVRDFMWFLGSSWATFLYGYRNISCLYL